MKPTTAHSVPNPGFPSGSSYYVPMLDRHSAACNTTKQTETERALAETKRQLEAVFESMADPVIIVDAHGAVVASNTAYRDVFGISECAVRAANKADPPFELRSLLTPA